MHPWLRLVRVGNVLTALAGTVVGGLAARGAGIPSTSGFWLVVLLAAASTAFVTAGGNVVNDVLDRETDRTNHPDRPLVTGAIGVGTAKLGGGALLVLGVGSIVPVALRAPLLLPILLVAIGALLGYEFFLKSHGFSGNLLVAFLTAAVFLYGGAAVGNVVAVIPFSLMAFGATLSRELIKDMEDAGGDKDRQTLPRLRGFGVATGIARLSAGIAIALSPVPLLTLLTPWSIAGIMYLALVVAADALFVASVAALPERLHRGQTLSKAGMTVALLAFLAAAFR
ncbi:MAG: UbiA family prenyltransferase [Thermoplasmata archaeon]|nr:UbiA family prenyltransferase [Thermoplasmata archaeon]MCI4355989.1 UbiA family prenyltransferase [Thermoplasmata archaeon]